MEKQRSAPPAPDLPVGLYVQNTIEELTKELRQVGPIGDSKSRLRFSVASVIKRGSEVSASQETKSIAQTTPELTNSVRSIKVVLVDKYDSSRRFLLEQMLVKSEEIPSEQDGFELWASYQTLSRQNLLLVVQRWLKNITTSLLVLFNNSSLSSWLLNPLSNEESECASELKKRFNLDLEISTISASEGSEEDQLDKRLDYVFEARHSIKRCTITLKMAQLKNYSSIREQLKYEMLEQTSRRTSSQGGSSGRPRLLSENYLTELAHMSGEGAVETRKNNLQESPDDSNTSLELSWSNRSLSRPFVLQEALCEDLGRRKRSIGNYCGTDKQAFGMFISHLRKRTFSWRNQRKRGS